MPAPYFSKLKFQGGANLDFIEIAVDTGLNISGIQVIVYNRNGNRNGTVRSINDLGTLKRFALFLCQKARGNARNQTVLWAFCIQFVIQIGHETL